MREVGGYLLSAVLELLALLVREERQCRAVLGMPGHLVTESRAVKYFLEYSHKNFKCTMILVLGD